MEWGMSTAADHFTSFVDALADVLDDHDATGDVLAKRLYVSRFHLDRIISSVDGEPPARFRRRILLERAAYRLLSTQMTILAGRGAPVRGLAARTARGRGADVPLPRPRGRRAGIDDLGWGDPMRWVAHPH